MAKKFYFGLVLVFLSVFLLNNIFMRKALEENYQKTSMTNLVGVLSIVAKRVQRKLTNDRRIKLTQYREYLGNLVSLYFLQDTGNDNGMDSRQGPGANIQLAIANRLGMVIANSTTATSLTTIPDEILSTIATAQGKFSSVVNSPHKSAESYYIYTPMHQGDGDHMGYLVLVITPDFNKAWVDKKLSEHNLLQLKIGLAGLAFVLLFTFAFVGKCRNTRRLQKKIYFGASISIALVLGAVLLFNGILYQKNYYSVLKDNAQSYVQNITDEDKEKIAGAEQLASDYARIYDSKIAAKLHDHFEIVYSKQSTESSLETGAVQNRVYSSIDKLLLYPVAHDDQSIAFTLSSGSPTNRQNYDVTVSFSIQTLLKETSDYLVTATTLLLVSILLLVEFIYLLVTVTTKTSPANENDRKVLTQYMRPAMFFFLLGIDISMAFVPLHMQNLYTPIFGLSEDIAMGLPISVEFLFVGIFILVSGIWVDRRGWHEPFLIGLALSAGGGLYSWLAPDAVQFILSRALIGTGYGLTLMAAQGFIVKYSGPDGKATGLANIFAGLYAGSICGAVVGSVLAELYGYRYVFMLGGVILIGVIGYTYLLMRGAMERTEKPKADPGKGTEKWAMRKVARFFFNPEVIALSMFSSMPAAIAVVGFLNYFVPVYLDHISVSESTIGQVLMIYGFSLIFMGPLVGRYIDKSKSKKNYVVFGGIIGAMAFLIFDANAGVSAAIISVILLGISSSFVLSSQSTMILHLQVTKDLGEAKALGIFRSTSRLGQVMGPIIFGGIFLASDINSVMNYFGIAYLLAVLLLVFVVKDGRDSKAKKTKAQEDALSPQLETVATQD